VGLLGHLTITTAGVWSVSMSSTVIVSIAVMARGQLGYFGHWDFHSYSVGISARQELPLLAGTFTCCLAS
jgi:hypothetical protein